MLVIVLGAPNDAKGNLLPFALARCNKAFSFYTQYSDKAQLKFICTGGFGEHFNTTNIAHGEYVKKYLIEQGISSEQFLPVVESRFTFEDATLCEPYFAKLSDVKATVITSDFHIERAKLIFTRLFPKVSFSFIAAMSEIDNASRKTLEAHEIKAIAREKTNIASYNRK